ncbi:squalene--hopene cyclase, partial [Streptomyces xanthochromogenes]
MTATTDGSTGAPRPRAAAASATTGITPGADAVLEAARQAAERGVEHLLARQDAQGWWKGDLETNVTMDAEDLLLRQFLGIQDEKTLRAAALFIRGEQRDDG